MAHLETQTLTQEFGGLRALDEVSMAIERGELVSLIGPNGAGKSTLINTITGQLEPTSGEITYEGTDIAGLQPYEIAQIGIGRSFQTASIFPELSVRDNVEIAAFATEHGSFSLNFLRRRESYDDVIERADRVMETIELEEHADTKAEALPYGDTRRLEVAIGLATGPDFMFMDEPTAGMSPGETDMTVELMRSLQEDWGMTVFLVEHDMDVIFDVSERIFVLNEGSLIAQGPPEEIQDDPAVREAYLGGEEI
jgi:branched-chain amino acid transport system ATP-binding protein